MDVQMLLRKPRFRLEQGGAAEPGQVKQFREAAPPNLPRTYLRFMEACNGARGKIPYETGFLELWPLERARAGPRARARAQPAGLLRLLSI